MENYVGVESRSTGGSQVPSVECQVASGRKSTKGILGWEKFEVAGVLAVSAVARIAVPQDSAHGGVRPAWHMCRPKGRRYKTLRLWRCIRNKRRLAMNDKNLSKTYIIEIKTVSLPLRSEGNKTRGGINEG